MFNRILFVMNGFIFSVSLASMLGITFMGGPAVLVLSGIYLTYYIQCVE